MERKDLIHSAQCCIAAYEAAENDDGNSLKECKECPLNEQCDGYLGPITIVKGLMELLDKQADATTKPLTRAGILDSARRCVCGQREQDYGSPENNFETIALLWGIYLHAAHPELRQAFAVNGIQPEDVGVMMALLKIARIATGSTADSFIDLAGYAACAGEIALAKGRDPS